MRRAAFSLLEVISVGAVLTILLSLSLSSLRTSKPTVDTRAAALQIADQIRALRQQAVSGGLPAGFSLPSQNGTRWVAGAYQTSRGESNAVLRAVTRLDSDSAQLFLGRYNGPTWSTVRPPGLLGKAPVLASWNAGASQDPMLFFSPDGTVHSNAPHDGGRYRLVVGKALAASAGDLTA